MLKNFLHNFLHKYKYKTVLIFLTLLVLFYFKNILFYINTQVSIMTNKTNKVVVFDLDETLGCFNELGIFWDALENFYGSKLSNSTFVAMLNVFPEFCRPDILKILDYLHRKKKTKACQKIIIYTNNQGPKTWVKMITDYFDYKLGYSVFDQIIGAYKIGNKIIEEKRTTHDKSLKDLLSCTQLPPTTEFCFIDDLYHPLMKRPCVFYFNIKPYHYSMPYDIMANRYYNLVVIKNKKAAVSREMFVNNIVAYMSKYKYKVISKSKEAEETDKIESKKLKSYLEDFFKRDHAGGGHTRKQRSAKNKKTRSIKRFFN